MRHPNNDKLRIKGSISPSELQDDAPYTSSIPFLGNSQNIQWTDDDDNSRLGSTEIVHDKLKTPEISIVSETIFNMDQRSNLKEDYSQQIIAKETSHSDYHQDDDKLTIQPHISTSQKNSDFNVSSMPKTSQTMDFSPSLLSQDLDITQLATISTSSTNSPCQTNKPIHSYENLNESVSTTFPAFKFQKNKIKSLLRSPSHHSCQKVDDEEARSERLLATLYGSVLTGDYPKYCYRKWSLYRSKPQYSSRYQLIRSPIKSDNDKLGNEADRKLLTQEYFTSKSSTYTHNYLGHPTSRMTYDESHQDDSTLRNIPIRSSIYQVNDNKDAAVHTLDEEVSSSSSTINTDKFHSVKKHRLKKKLHLANEKGRSKGRGKNGELLPTGVFFWKDSYVANWFDSKKRKQFKVSFKISDHGDQLALELATLARELRTLSYDQLIKHYNKRNTLQISSQLDEQEAPSLGDASSTTIPINSESSISLTNSFYNVNVDNNKSESTSTIESNPKQSTYTNAQNSDFRSEGKTSPSLTPQVSLQPQLELRRTLTAQSGMSYSPTLKQAHSPNLISKHSPQSRRTHVLEPRRGQTGTHTFEPKETDLNDAYDLTTSRNSPITYYNSYTLDRYHNSNYGLIKNSVAKSQALTDNQNITDDETTLESLITAFNRDFEGTQNIEKFNDDQNLEGNTISEYGELERLLLPIDNKDDNSHPINL